MIGIKDFKMPKGCGDCVCYDVEWARCAFVNKSAEDFDKRLEDCPLVADVEPIKHGYWTYNGYYLCSHCHHYTYQIARRAYCPKCGAKMDGKEENNTH